MFDWSDGRIARRLNGRTAEQRAVGAQLDSLIDIVSFSVVPALLLLSLGRFSVWFVPGAFVVLATGAIRLSYFNVFGLLGKATYPGSSLDNNVLVVALLFLVEPLVGRDAVALILYAVLDGAGRPERGLDRRSSSAGAGTTPSSSTRSC